MGTNITKEQILMRIIGLFSNATELIQKELRDPEQVDNLLKAMQLFKENTTYTIVPFALKESEESIVDDGTQKEETDFQKLFNLKENKKVTFDTKIYKKLFSLRTLACVKDCGIMFVGELYKMQWISRVADKSTIKKEINDFLIAQGLPDIDSNPEWIPEYLSNISPELGKILLMDLNTFRKLILVKCKDTRFDLSNVVLKDLKKCISGEMESTMLVIGDYFCVSKVPCSNLRGLRHSLSHYPSTTKLLHSGIRLPANWREYIK